MRQKLNDNEKKVSITVTINPILNSAIADLKNKSKYIEQLIYKDLIRNNKIDENTIL